MKINIGININSKVDDTLLDNYLINENITLQEYKESIEQTVFEMIDDEIGEEFVNKTIDVKVYFEKEE